MSKLFCCIAGLLFCRALYIALKVKRRGGPLPPRGGGPLVRN